MPFASMDGLSPAGRRSIGFLDIPLEIRQQIYHSSLVRPSPILINDDLCNDNCLYGSGTEDKVKSLLLVCKKIYQEASDVLYGSNIFRVTIDEEDEPDLKRAFTEANRRKIRKLQIVVFSMSCLFAPCPTLDGGFWSPILAQLTRLSIVAAQPLRIYHRAPWFNQDMKNWVEWARTVLQFVAQRLHSSCIVEVDDDDREETSALIKEFFPGGYRKVRTRAGDFYFRRGEYSPEAGYLPAEWRP
jgi:hypothetical protein